MPFDVSAKLRRPPSLPAAVTLCSRLPRGERMLSCPVWRCRGVGAPRERWAFVGQPGFFFGGGGGVKTKVVGPLGGTCPRSLGCPLGHVSLAFAGCRSRAGGAGGVVGGGKRGSAAKPMAPGCHRAPPRAAASPPRRAHHAALPRRRQLLHAAIYSEGHLLLSVVAKPSKDCMPRKIPPW